MYVNKKTYAAIRKAHVDFAKRQYPYYSKKNIMMCVELELLNYGPCVIDGVEDNHVIKIVD